MGTSVSSAIMARIRTFAAAAAAFAFALALGLAPMAFAAEDSVSTGNVQVESVAGPLVGPGYEGDARSASPNSSNEPQQVSASQDANDLRVASMLASGLFDSPAGIISSDVALDAADPVIGSFTVDGLTYAINDGGVALISVAGPLAGPEGEGSAEGGFTNISIPASVTYNDITYPVTAIGPYAFYLSGATSVELPESIVSVDDHAFRSSDVARVEVGPGNPNMASYEGALYSADKSRLLLIPEGRAGSVPIPSEAEVVEASKFSHCSLVDAISADGDGAAFASWDGLLYSADGTTLLRVPAGATEITIRDGCTTIAAGAMEGCAKLERINAPASVTSISPDVFQSVPTISLPAQMAVQDGTTSGVASALADQAKEPADSSGAEGEAEVSPRRVVASSQGLEAPDVLPDLGSTSASPSSEASGSAAPQLTAMVALSTTDDDLPEVDPSSIEVVLPEGADAACWQALGVSVMAAQPAEEPVLSVQASNAYAISPTYAVNVYANGHVLASQLSANRLSDGGRIHTGAWSPLRDDIPFPWNGRSDIATGWDAWTPKAGKDAGLYVYFLNAPYNGIVDSYQFVYLKGDTPGWTLRGFGPTPTSSPYDSNSTIVYRSEDLYALWRANAYTISLDAQGGSVSPSSIAATYDQDATLPAPADRPGYRFLGWDTQADGSGARYQAGAVRNLTAEDGATVTLYAQWERVDYDIGFDTSSEPSDADYPGDAKPDESANIDSGQVPIEDPKRPGYVFEGWVIPTEDGTEAVDQDLVYQGADKKWYVDASKLPDYADSDGKVELTARWTSIISVDVPSSVTFYADLVTQGQESREGAASGAFGQSKVSNQSQVDLRVVGLESSAVKTEGSTLGADSILKKADAATPSTSTQKLLSLYPSTKQWKPEELQNPDAVGGSKAATAVDFDLDDILLEKSFKADDFTIAAGGTLNMGYRLNLSETGQQLDYDKLATLAEGQSASIANVSYCFAADALPSDWDEPLWIENPDRTSNLAKYLLLDDIKAAANDLSANGTSSEYYDTYKGLLDAQVTDNGNPGAGPYFQLKVDGVYLPLQLIGICQDTKSDGTGNAGLTFQMRDIYACYNRTNDMAGGNTFNYTYMNPSDTNAGGWGSSSLRAILRSVFWDDLPPEVQKAIAPVDKYQQLPGGTSASYLQKTTDETVWLPSVCEVGGVSFRTYNESERQAANGYVPFQYMAYQGNSGSGLNRRSVKVFNDEASYWWLRSAYRANTTTFFGMSAPSYGIIYGGAKGSGGCTPAFCL